MGSKGFTLLVVITGIVVIAALTGLQQKAKPELKEKLFATLVNEVNDIDLIKLDIKGASVIIKKEAGQWVVENKANYPAKSALAKEILASLAMADKLEPKTQHKDKYDKLGVADIKDSDKSVLVTLQKGDSVVASILVGNNRTGIFKSFYVRHPQQKKTWLVSGNMDVRGTARDWLRVALISIDKQRIQTITIKNEQQTLSLIKKTDKAAHFVLQDIDSDYEVKSEFMVDAVADTLSGLTLEDVLPISKISTEKAIIAEFQTFDGLIVQVNTVMHEGQPWSHFKASKTTVDLAKEVDAKRVEEITSINNKLAAWWFKLPQTSIDSLTQKKDDLLNKKEAPVAEEKSEIDAAIEVKSLLNNL